MSSLVHAVFGTEITEVPNGLQKLLGSNFNNAFCNGITWLVFFWLTLHFTYDRLINLYLKKLGFSQYLRTRLSDSFWLLTFYVSFFIYYLITINEYNTRDLMYYKRNISIHYEVISNKQKIAQALICSFYMFMTYKEGIQLGSWHAVKYVALTIACTTAFILRFLEIPFTITALIAVSGIFQELSKMFYSLLNKENSICNVFIGSLYILSVLIFCAVYFTIIPLSYLVPLGMKLFTRERNPLIFTLFLSLLCWINLLIYKSIFLNAMFHWLYHIKNPSKDENDVDEDEKQPIQLECLGNIVECSLFPPRTDDSFMLAFMRSEARKRQRKMIALRKPKNKALMIQTIRCVMALQKTLSKRKTMNQDPATNAPLECDIFEEQEATNNEEERVLIPVKMTNKMIRLSKEEILLKDENLDTKDNAEEEEEREIRTVEVNNSKSNISNNKDDESVVKTVKESQSDTEIIEAFPSKEKHTQTMKLEKVISTDKDSQTTQSKEMDNKDKNLSSIKECLIQEKCLQLDRDAAAAGSKNVACLSKICARVIKKEGEGKGNSNNKM